MPLDVQLTFDSGADGFRVHAYEYDDALQDAFSLTLRVTHEDPALDPRDFMGRPVVVALPDETVVQRIAGIVRRFEQRSSEPTGASRYELSVVPPVWLTRKSRDHRIFQNLSAEEICRQVISGYGGIVPEAVLSKSPGRQVLEYRVQWGESDFDFMRRVLAEDGVTAFFDHANGSAWTFNARTTEGLTILSPFVPFVPPGGEALRSTSPHVSAVRITSNLAPGSKMIRDFDFQKPRFLMEKLKTTGATRLPAFGVEGDLDDYEFDVGSFTTATDRDGDSLATQYLEEARAGWRELSCETDFMLSAGFHWAIEGHPRSDVNAPLLVVRAHSLVAEATDGRVPVRKHTLTCVPADVPWRPARSPKPTIAGPQTAAVVAEVAGTEIDVDDHGRVLLGFRWDRRDIAAGKPTRRVRVSQAWAGAGFGFDTMPRVGTEVVVEYLDGDPDQPLVTGRVHNAETVSPLRLPEEKTRSIWKSQSSPGGDGFNLIMMEDKKGEELLEFRAEKDKLTNVLASHSENVGGSQTSHVGGAVVETYGASQFTEVETTKTTLVGGNVSEGYGAELKTIVAAQHRKLS
ncbi:MAG: type VI secretion system tip protein TssI/VgrG, partial [Polyangiaceae bacterium]